MQARPSASEELKQSFTDRHTQAVTQLQTKHQKTLEIVHHKTPLAALGTSTGHMLASGAISSAMLLAPGKIEAILPPLFVPDTAQVTTTEAPVQTEMPTPELETAKPTISKNTLSQLLMPQLPAKPQPLTPTQESEISRIIEQNLHFKAGASLDGHRLNTSYGLMGYEQHLLRFPGDTIAQHDEYKSTGITGSTGAWGYFAPSKSAMTEKQVQMEKYYFAVQTFRAPEWRQNVYQLKEWFKFRKMVAINPKTGDVVVGVVGDAGPAVWTGKTSGGSPEMMHDLKLGGGMRKGEVILFFVDDPNDTIPLGPLTFHE